MRPATVLLTAALLGPVGCTQLAVDGDPAAAPAATAARTPDLALLPLQGLLADVEDVRHLRGLLAEAFAAGAGPENLVPNDRIEASLAADRIRIVDSLAPELSARLAQTLGARLVTASLVQASQEPEPTAALLLRFYDRQGQRLGSQLWLRRGSQDVDLFGLEASGDLDTLFQRSVSGIVHDALDRLEGSPGTDRPRLAVFPFESNWETPLSGPLAALITAHVLEEDFDVEVLEPGDLNSSFQEARIRYLRLASPEQVRTIGRAAGARWLLTGSVLAFELGAGEEDPPTATLVLRVFDVESGKTVASTLAGHTGDEGEILFGAGMTLHPIENLAAAIRDGLDDLESTWQGS